MADGKVSLPYSRFLGYRKGEDDLPEIVPEEAEFVRLIYRSFMEGLTTNKIAQVLWSRKFLHQAVRKSGTTARLKVF